VKAITLLIQLAGCFFSILGAWWVWHDATKLKAQGANLTPRLWAIFVFLIWCLGLPLYLIFRRTVWRKELRQPVDELVKEFE